MFVAESVLWSIVCLCVTFVVYRGIECLRANTAAGLRAADRSRRDELHEMERLIEKFQYKDDVRIMQQHSVERQEQVRHDSSVEKVASAKLSEPKKRYSSLISTDPDLAQEADVPCL